MLVQLLNAKLFKEEDEYVFTFFMSVITNASVLYKEEYSWCPSTNKSPLYCDGFMSNNFDCCHTKAVQKKFIKVE